MLVNDLVGPFFGVLKWWIESFQLVNLQLWDSPLCERLDLGYEGRRPARLPLRRGRLLDALDAGHRPRGELHSARGDLADGRGRSGRRHCKMGMLHNCSERVT